MSYDVVIQLGSSASLSDVDDVLMVHDGFRPNRPKAWCCDLPSESVFFTVEARTKLLGLRVKELTWNLCYGGTPDEAAYFATTIAEVARRLKGTIHDPQLARQVGPDEAALAIVPKWLEANVWALGNYSDGSWLVRSPAGRALVDGKTLQQEAVRTPDPVQGFLSLSVCWARLRDYERANEVLEKVVDLDPGCSVALGLLALGHLQLGNAAEAKKRAEQALEVDADNSTARHVLDEVAEAKRAARSPRASSKSGRGRKGASGRGKKGRSDRSSRS